MRRWLGAADDMTMNPKEWGLEEESTLSDTPQGEGWWQASDGKWYSPEMGPAEGPRSSVGSSSASGTISPTAALEPTTASAGRQREQGDEQGDFVTFIGWLIFVCGIGVIMATLVKLSDSDNEFLELSLGDYLMALSPGFTVVGIGAIAGALGSILRQLTRR